MSETTDKVKAKIDRAKLELALQAMTDARDAYWDAQREVERELGFDVCNVAEGSDMDTEEFIDYAIQNVDGELDEEGNYNG
jgi:hypothetical protein